MREHLGYATVAILGAVRQGHRFGLDIMRQTGLPSGTVYPTLARAERSGLVRSRWEDSRHRRPRGDVRDGATTSSRPPATSRWPAAPERLDALTWPARRAFRKARPMIRVARFIIRASARLVPPDLRRDWTEQWLGELLGARRRIRTARRPRQLLAFALGAPRHAIVEAVDDWTIERHRPRRPGPPRSGSPASPGSPSSAS